MTTPFTATHGRPIIGALALGGWLSLAMLG